MDGEIASKNITGIARRIHAPGAVGADGLCPVQIAKVMHMVGKDIAGKPYSAHTLELRQICQLHMFQCMAVISIRGFQKRRFIGLDSQF